MQLASFQDVLAFWFSSAQSSRWYAKDHNLDAGIRRRFLTTHEAACSGKLDEWRSAPESLLALIILLDQFPRNMFRGSARAFASDAQAVSLTREGIDKGFDRCLSGAQLQFFYMPLMHSESLSDQDLLIERGMATIATRGSIMRSLRGSAVSRTETKRCDARAPPRKRHIWLSAVPPSESMTDNASSISGPFLTI
jgi:uncharacterized protein (DUF924 family)